MALTRSKLALALATTCAAATLASCGGSSSDGGGGASATAKKGGTFAINFTSFPDYLDPALSYTAEGWTTLRPVYNGLLVFKRAEGAEGSQIVPGLAEDMPEISDDGLTYTLTLRKGLKYSDGTAVKASDFQRTIQRVLNLESGASSFFQAIKGADEYIKAGKATAPISGIKTDDATGKIEITLKQKNGQLENYLAIPFASLVPGDTPFKNLTSDPPPGVGPMKFTDVKPSRGWKLVRNENFTPLPNIADGAPDEIDATIVKNQRRQVADVLANKVDMIFDNPTPDLMQRVRNEGQGRFKAEITNSTYYFFLNNTVAPFDNEKVRQAVGFAVDERALERFFGGMMAPTCNFLPPGMKGYKKIDPCPYGDPAKGPNLEKAKAMIQEAGVAGESVTVWGNDENLSRSVTEYLADTLNQIGLKAKPRIVEASTYFQVIGNQKTKPQIGFANWFQDFPHPADFLFLINGGTIQDTNNLNYGNVNDEEVNSILDEADQNPDLDAVADDYAKADRLVVERALAIPYGNAELSRFTSARVNFDAFQFHPVFNQELLTLSLK